MTLINKMTPTTFVLNDVLNERISQDLKWKQQDHSFDDWLAILGEELGEAVKAPTPQDARKELVQCAAVIVNMIECSDRNGGFPSDLTIPEDRRRRQYTIGMIYEHLEEVSRLYLQTYYGQS